MLRTPADLLVWCHRSSICGRRVVGIRGLALVFLAATSASASAGDLSATARESFVATEMSECLKSPSMGLLTKAGLDPIKYCSCSAGAVADTVTLAEMKSMAEVPGGPVPKSLADKAKAVAATCVRNQRAL